MNRYKYENRIFYASNIIVDNSYQNWFNDKAHFSDRLTKALLGEVAFIPETDIKR